MPSRSNAFGFARLLPATLLAALPPALFAHPTVSATAVLRIDAAGHVVVLISHDALAFALDDTPRNVSDAAMFGLLEGTDEALTQVLGDARDRFAALFEVLADGRRIDTQIAEFPTAEAVREFQRDNGARRLPVRLGIDVRAVLPSGTRGVQVRFPDVLGDLILTVDRPHVEPFALPLVAGETSPVIDVRPPPASGPALRAAASTPTTPAPAPISSLAVAWRYAQLGFNHIIPEGTDHALFVLGLFLLSPRFKTVLWQITAFTVAHTVTLTLTALHLIWLPDRIIEPAIALSIAFIGVENLVTTKVHAWRPLVAFAFGLVHGMGVASELIKAGFPEGQLVSSLAAFTVGVEGGHVFVLALAFLVLGWCGNKPWYRGRVAIPISMAIAGVAIYWMVQRVLAPA